MRAYMELAEVAAEAEHNNSHNNINEDDELMPLRKRTPMDESHSKASSTRAHMSEWCGKSRIRQDLQHSENRKRQRIAAVYGSSPSCSQ